jgi:SAM-dependent methyltransferase
VGDAAELRGYGGVFNQIAGEYDRHRPAYPDALVDRACERAELAPGAAVLEIGCGTGQLTRSLLARGLRVMAVEPGAQLAARARAHLPGAGDVEFLNVGLEEARLPRARYPAAFAASAIHWVDPNVGWRAIADALVDGGTVALLSYFGLQDRRSDEDQRALRSALARVAPELAGEWPVYRDLDATLAGAARRQHNLSEVWAWLGSHDVARGYVGDLFAEVQIAAIPTLVEHTADALNAMLGTMSFWARLTPEGRETLIAENRALHRQLDRPIRSSIIACLVTARRVART